MRAITITRDEKFLLENEQQDHDRSTSYYLFWKVVNKRFVGYKGKTRKPRWVNWNGIQYTDFTFSATEEVIKRIKEILSQYN